LLEKNMGIPGKSVWSTEYGVLGPLSIRAPQVISVRPIWDEWRRCIVPLLKGNVF